MLVCRRAVSVVVLLLRELDRSGPRAAQEGLSAALRVRSLRFRSRGRHLMAEANSASLRFRSMGALLSAG